LELASELKLNETGWIALFFIGGLLAIGLEPSG
jgi:hypothetical protein